MMLHNRSVTGKFETQTTDVNNTEKSSCGSLNAKTPSFETTITRTKSFYEFRVPDHEFNETSPDSVSGSDLYMDISDADSDMEISYADSNVNNKHTTAMSMEDVSLKISNLNLRNYSHIKLHQAVPNQCRPIKRKLRNQEMARQRVLLAQGRVQREQDRIRSEDGSRQRRNMLWREQGVKEYERIRREKERATQEQEIIQREEDRSRQNQHRIWKQEQERIRQEQDRSNLEQERARQEQERARMELVRVSLETERQEQRLIREQIIRSIIAVEEILRKVEELLRIVEEQRSILEELPRIVEEQQLIVEDQPRTVGRNSQTPSRGMTMEDVRLLPLRPYSHSNELNSGHRHQQNGQCSICLELYESGDLLRTLPCFHWYHPTCINKWLLINKICPMCRCTVSIRGQ